MSNAFDSAGNAKRIQSLSDSPARAQRLQKVGNREILFDG